MWGFIQQYLLKDWRVIKNAPVAFFGLLGILCVGIWWVMDWQYGGQIDTKDATIQFQRERLDEHEQRQAGRPDNNTLSRVYQLTPDQWARFVEAAEVPPGLAYRVFIYYNGSCEECAILAQNLLNRLTSIPGWESSGGAGMPDPLQKGLLVQVHSKTKVPAEAKAIAHALQAAGLDAMIVEEPVLGENTASQLFIGIPQ